jgi:hypothetical protein
VEIRFMERVFCDFPARNGMPGCSVQVSGLYDHSRKVVEITSADSPFREDRKPWGIEWGPEISCSILQHELTHMAVGAILGDRFGDLGVPWHEFIAYAVQFELMPPSLRSRALDARPDATAFASAGHVNAMSHAMDPDAFAIRSYLYEDAHGGGPLVAEIIGRAASGVAGGDAEYLWTD